MEIELKRREARLVAARKALAELSTGSAGVELLAEIDRAHVAVEVAERRLDAAWLLPPSLALRARRRLRKAQKAERAILAAHGYESWLGLQLRRVDALFAQPPPEDVAAAEVEHRQAVAAWEALTGDPDPPAEAAISFPSLLNVVLGPEPARPAVA